MNPLVLLALQELPRVIQTIQDRHLGINPALPRLTDSEAIAICRLALDSTEAKDDNWLALHPGQ